MDFPLPPSNTSQQALIHIETAFVAVSTADPPNSFGEFGEGIEVAPLSKLNRDRSFKVG